MCQSSGKLQLCMAREELAHALTKKADSLRPGNSLKPCVETQTFYGVGKAKPNKDCSGRNSRVENHTGMCVYLSRVAAFVMSGGRPV